MLKRIVALLIAAVGFSWLSLLSGCGSGCGDIEDEVFIQKALEHFIATQSETGVNFTEGGPVEQVYLTYSSIEEFRVVNPDCCSFGYRGFDGALPTWRRRFATDYAGMVIINFNRRTIEGDTIRNVLRETAIPMNSCAEPIQVTLIWPR